MYIGLLDFFQKILHPQTMLAHLNICCITALLWEKWDCGEKGGRRGSSSEQDPKFCSSYTNYTYWSGESTYQLSGAVRNGLKDE